MEVRFSRLHNASMAAVAAGMVVVGIGHFLAKPDTAPSLSLNDTRFVVFLVLGVAMAFYVWMGITRWLDRMPQIVIDGDGIALGFGRNRRVAWQDIEWARLRRMGFRPQLQLGIAPAAFAAADLRLSMLNLDDALRPIRGTPSAVMVRDNGLDTTAAAMLDAIKSFRPNLVRS